mmetsp:Transcript_44690/g.142423  ORF Transcript_44690/g.142423 Transcript_44690/m.142423 type:complete len:490 (+) Transcript_44690:93-1562(+)
MADTRASYGATEPVKEPLPKTTHQRLAPFVAEFLGTFVLVFTVGCCVLSPASSTWSAASIACVLMAMIYSTGPISGGNLNPAVSFSLGVTGDLPWRTVLKYWAVQVIAGIAAGSCFCALFSPRSVAVGPKAPFTWQFAFLAEVIYTFMLCFVVNNCAASKRNNPKDDGNQFYALAIGFVIVAGGYAAGSVSGACFNPAVSLGLAGTGTGLKWAFAWVGAELIGGLLAALAFRALRSEEYILPVDGLPAYAPKLRARCMSEFLGAFMLVFTVGLNITTSSPATAFSAAAALMCMVFSLGNVSGAHFNPAVTLAVVSSGRSKCLPADGLAYAAAQALGGIFAGLLSAAFHAAGPNSSSTFGLGPGIGYGPLAAGVGELCFTFVLAYTVLACATVTTPASWLTKQNFYFGLAIGSCVTAGGVAIGAVSGGELNPAVSLGIATGSMAHRGATMPPPLTNCISFCLWELAGGILASVVFRLTHPDEYLKAPLSQ